MPEKDELEQKSFILVSFKEVNSVEMQVNFMNVSPAQALAAAAIIEVKSKNAYIQMENERQEREAQMQIARPTGDNKIIVGR
jgi:hypothetical protein